MIAISLYALVFYILAFHATKAGDGVPADFFAFYTGATIAHEGNLSKLYDPATQLAVEHRFAPDRETPQPYLNPPVFAIALSPLAALSIEDAYSVAVVFGLLCLGFGLLLLHTILRGRGLDQRGIAIYLIAFALTPVLWAVWAGQPSPLIVSAILLSMVLAPKHPVLAGLLLTTLLIKPHFAPAFAVAIIARPRMLAGFGIGVVLVAVISAIVLTPHGIVDMIQLYRAELDETAPSIQQNWTGFAYSFLPAPIITGMAGTAILTCVALAGVFMLRHAEVSILYGGAALAAIIGNQHVHIYDLGLLGVTGIAIYTVFRRPDVLVVGYYFLFIAALIASRADASVTVFPLAVLAVWYWREARVADHGSAAEADPARSARGRGAPQLGGLAIP